MIRAEMYEPSTHSAVMLEHVSQIAWTLALYQSNFFWFFFIHLIFFHLINLIFY
jgi:hypothetical protein